MKKYTLFISAFLLSAICMAQTKPVKILFDVTSGDTTVHQTALRHVSGMAAAYPQSAFEVVIYGKAIGMVLEDKSRVAKEIAKLETNKNVSFKVCAVTLKRQNITQDQLLKGVEVVPDAILEIVTKQGEGWGYIKEARD
jgi:hypothetical protein